MVTPHPGVVFRGRETSATRVTCLVALVRASWTIQYTAVSSSGAWLVIFASLV
jgi:hypothetical protein